MTLPFYQNSSQNKLGETALQFTKLLEAGFPIPKGFIVPGVTCDVFFTSGKLKDKIIQLVERCDFGNPTDVSRVNQTIKKLVMSAEIPAEVSEPLLAAAVKLPKGKVMLVPSALDLRDREIPRIFGLTGEASILLGIRQLWASLFEPGNLYTVSSSSFPSLAICVQVEPEMVASGKLTTVDSRDKSACVVKAVWGGGGIVGDLQGSDVYILDRHSGQEKEKVRSLQTKETVFLHGKAESEKLPPIKQKKQKLTSNALKQLAELAGKLHHTTFFPQDVDFAFDGKKIFLMRVRAAEHEAIVRTIIPPADGRRVLLKGLGMSSGIITGMVRVVRGPQEKQVTPANILVSTKLSQLSPDLIRSAKGIILEEETPTHEIMGLSGKGIAILSAAAGATDLLEPGSFVTLHAPRGEVLAGAYRAEVEKPVAPVARTAMRLGTQLQLGKTLPTGLTDPRGHLLLSPQHLILDVGIHPLKLIREKKSRTLATTLERAIKGVCAHYQTANLLYCFSNFTTAQYREMSGGKQYETILENNPSLGYYGSARILDLPKLIEPEIAALESVRRESYGRRISLLLPGIRTTYEISLWSRLLGDRLPRSANTRYFMELGIPSMLWQIGDAARFIDGIVLDLDVMATYIFAAELGSGNFRYQNEDLAPTLLAILEETIKSCRAQGLYLILKGELLEHEKYLEMAIGSGVAELNLPQEKIYSVKERVSVLEQELITHV